MRYGFIAGLLAGSLLVSGTALAGIKDGRYVSPGGEFSIAMQATMDKEFKLDKETANADIVLVDFQYSMAQAHIGFAQRTVEWIKLAQPLDPALFDRHAADTVNGYLEGRLAGSKFDITDKRKLRNESGQLLYFFSASGAVNGVPSAWQGVVVIAAGGIALVSELYTLGTKPMLDADGLTDAELMSWASTVRPGP